MDTVDAGQRPGRHALTAGTECWALPYRSDAPAQARGLAREALRRWGVPSATAGEVLLVVSELVTNAFEYARPPIAFHLGLDADNGQIRVQVTDGGPAATVGAWAAGCGDAEHGRGLLIVHQVASAHGDRTEAGRATHWAELTLAA